MEDTPNTPVCMEDTPNTPDETFMCTMISRLNDLLEEVKQHTPHDSSLPPTFMPPKHKRQERTIKPQPSTSHRRHPFSGRVGHKAEVMRSKVDSLNKISKAKSPESNAGGAGRGTKRRRDAL
ncbi:hypothetical protein F7725_013446, partial [Dissostichus mawsoni]